MKVCSNCKELKPISEFNNYNRAKDGKQYYCRNCNKEKACNRVDKAYKGNYIYLLLHDEVLMYVGYTSNIYERFTQHKREINDSMTRIIYKCRCINKVIFYRLDDKLTESECKFIEQEFIHLYNPLKNESDTLPKKNMSLDKTIKLRERFDTSEVWTSCIVFSGGNREKNLNFLMKSLDLVINSGKCSDFIMNI